MSKKELPNWDELLSTASRLQTILSKISNLDPVLVGGTASAIYAQHRLSIDADHVLIDLVNNFDEVLKLLESVAGWKTARVNRPVMILGKLDGIETGVRQLIRAKPLETSVVKIGKKSIKIPTAIELLRIKSVLILKRNATRDYIDFVALADFIGITESTSALLELENYYPAEEANSPLQQLIVQLANPVPYDLEETKLSEYKNLDPKWHDWDVIKEFCIKVSLEIIGKI